VTQWRARTSTIRSTGVGRRSARRSGPDSACGSAAAPYAGTARRPRRADRPVDASAAPAAIGVGTHQYPSATGRFGGSAIQPHGWGDRMARCRRCSGPTSTPMASSGST
jgi:hypothetical protein